MIQDKSTIMDIVLNRCSNCVYNQCCKYLLSEDKKDFPFVFCSDFKHESKFDFKAVKMAAESEKLRKRIDSLKAKEKSYIEKKFDDFEAFIRVIEFGEKRCINCLNFKDCNVNQKYQLQKICPFFKLNFLRFKNNGYKLIK